MKDTGVPALGAVPEHWQVRRLASLGRLFKGNGGSKEDDCAEGVPCVRYGDLYTTHTFHITRSRGFIPHEKVSEYTPIRYGDVLFAASGETIDEIGRSAVNLIESAACCGGDVVVFRPQFEVNARFLGYATDCRPAAVQKARMGRGITVKHIYDSELRNLVVAIPPLDEQAAIVRFLDHADRRIRQYIRAKKKLIGLLRERRQAIAVQLLTGDLDSKSPLSRSRATWLGHVPHGWTVVRLKAILRAVDVRSKTGSETLLSLRRDHGIVVYAEHFKRPPQAQTIVGFKLVEPNQIVVNRLQANNGLIFCSTVRGLVSPDYSVFKATAPVSMEFLATVLRTPIYRTHFRREATGLGTGSSGFLRLYDDRFLDTLVALPPVNEQERLLSVLLQQTSALDTLVARQYNQIEFIAGLRHRLISDLVTGKLDVREAARQLPDKPEEADVPESRIEAAEEVEDADELMAEEAEA